jgi:hypothetical protein
MKETKTITIEVIKNGGLETINIYHHECGKLELIGILCTSITMLQQDFEAPAKPKKKTKTKST